MDRKQWERASWLPTLTRRNFWQAGAVSVVGRSLLPLAAPLNAFSEERVSPRAGADCVIFVNLVGSPSQMDTFDVKEAKWTPADLDIRTTRHGYRWPYGLLPRLGETLDGILIVRSMAAWETLHNLGQFYQQVGHQYTPARGAEMPSIGSVIAYELLTKAKESDYLPPHISMNFPAGSVNGNLTREGFLDSSTAPLTLDLRKGGNMPFIADESERERLSRRLDFLKSFDTSRHLTGSGVSKRYLEWESFTQSAVKMIQSPHMSRIFKLDPDERKRYGSTSMGDACIIARNMVAAEAGARYILISQGGWDHHDALYGKSEGRRGEDLRDRGGLYQTCGDLDPALASLLTDLKATKGKSGTPLLDRTFVVAVGEFGRTPGPLNDTAGRHHWADVRAGVFAGAGVKGGRVIGATDELGGKIAKFDWHKNRPIYPEDLTATIYSVLGIDWTKKLSGTPSGREFQYVEPMSGTNFLGSTEVKELFG